MTYLVRNGEVVSAFVILQSTIDFDDVFVKQHATHVVRITENSFVSNIQFISQKLFSRKISDFCSPGEEEELST